MGVVFGNNSYERWTRCRCIDTLQRLASCHANAGAFTEQKGDQRIKKRMLRASTLGTTLYNDYTPEERMSIGKYATENGIASAVRHCLGKVPKGYQSQQLEDSKISIFEELLKGQSAKFNSCKIFHMSEFCSKCQKFFWNIHCILNCRRSRASHTH